LIKTNKNFLIVKTLCLINKKIVDINNFTVEDGIIIENNVELLNNKKLNGQDNWELGFIYENIGKKEKALEHYQKALISVDIINKKDKSNILSDIAHIYEALGDIQKSNEYYEKSIKEDENNLVAK
jgi:tetratricopeptide (TPR) repeat protein